MGGPSSPPQSPTGPDAPVAAAATLPRDPSTPAGREDARTAAVASSPSPALQPLQRSAPAAPASEPSIDAVARASPPTSPPTPAPLQSRLPRANRRLLSATTEIQLPQDALTFRPKLFPTLNLSEPASSDDQVAELLRSALHISSYSRSAPRPPQPSPVDGIVEGATAALVLDSPAHRLRRRHASSGAAGAGLFAFRSRIPVPISAPPVASLRSASTFRSSTRPSPYPSAGTRRHRVAGSQAALEQESPKTAKLEQVTSSKHGRRNSWSSFELNRPTCSGSAVDAISPASSPLDLALLTVAFQSVALTPQPVEPSFGIAPRPMGDGKLDVSTFFVSGTSTEPAPHRPPPTPALMSPSVPTNTSPPTSQPTKSNTPAPSQPLAIAPLTHNLLVSGERRRPRAISSFGSPLLHAKGVLHRSAPRFSVTMPVGVLHNPRPRQARRAKAAAAAAVTATTFAPVATIRRHRQASTGHSARFATRRLGSLHAPAGQRPDGQGMSTPASSLPGAIAVLTPPAAGAGGSSPRPVASAFWVPIRSSRAVRSGASSAFLPAPVLGRTPPPSAAWVAAAAGATTSLSCRSTTAFSTAPYARTRSANAAATTGGSDGVRADVAEGAAGADGGSGSDADTSSEDGRDGDDDRRLAALFDRSVRVDSGGGGPDTPRQRAPFVC
ncbi:hypothetical protein HK405_002911 [Cladochytrium tenue]|nr:hypothetical protein HK405_002911 [Cladochytrium tenue]